VTVEDPFSWHNSFKAEGKPSRNLRRLAYLASVDVKNLVLLHGYRAAPKRDFQQGYLKSYATGISHGKRIVWWIELEKTVASPGSFVLEPVS
jgi:hypothetical protein